MINLKSEYEISSPIAKEDLAECLFDAISRNQWDGRGGFLMQVLSLIIISLYT